MALTTLAFQPTFNEATIKITGNDTTDYAGQGIPLDGTYTIGGYLMIQLSGPSGVTTVYNNLGGVTADVDPNVSLGTVNNIDLPLSTDGRALPGTYVFTYNVKVLSGLTVVADVTQNFTFTYDLDAVTASLSSIVNCQSSTVTSYDNTNYGTYATTITRAHTLYPPPSSGLPNQTVSSSVNIYPNNIVTTTWTQGISTDVTYTLPDGLIVQRNIVGTREFQVVCDTGLSTVMCCLDKLKTRFDSLLTKNPTQAALFFEETFEPTCQAMLFYYSAVQSGDANLADKYYAQVLSTSGCDSSCGCDDGTPQQVYPSGSAANNYAIDSPDNSISVTSDTAGSTVTFHLQVSAALQAAIGALHNTTVSTATPTYITINQTGTGPVDFSVDFNDAPVSDLVGVSVKQFVLDPTATDGAGNYYVLATNNINQQGSGFQSTGSQTFALGQFTPNLSTDVALIKLNNVLADNANPSAVFAQVNGFLDALDVTAQHTLDCEVLIVRDPEPAIVLRLFNPATGQPYTLADLKGAYQTILVACTIHA